MSSIHCGDQPSSAIPCRAFTSPARAPHCETKPGKRLTIQFSIEMHGTAAMRGAVPFAWTIFALRLYLRLENRNNEPNCIKIIQTTDEECVSMRMRKKKSLRTSARLQGLLILSVCLPEFTIKCSPQWNRMKTVSSESYSFANSFRRFYSAI